LLAACKRQERLIKAYQMLALAYRTSRRPSELVRGILSEHEEVNKSAADAISKAEGRQ
jgi:hypothetical protein